MTAPVYVRIQRPEGYEDVHPDLVIEDAAHDRASWQAEDATAYVERLEAAIRECVTVLPNGDLRLPCGHENGSPCENMPATFAVRDVLLHQEKP